MDKAQFWELIETTRTESQGDSFKQQNLIIIRLAELPMPEIIDFSGIHIELEALAYTHEMWNASTVLTGSASREGWREFCDWLILQGEAVFYSALSNPEDLANLPDSLFDQLDKQSHDLSSCLIEANELKTGIRDYPAPSKVPKFELRGQECQNWEEMQAKYPKLAGIFWKRHRNDDDCFWLFKD